MKARFVHIGFNFEGETPPINALEKVFNSALDWLRYDEHCWILYTTTELDIWRDRIRQTEGITTSMGFLLVEFDRSNQSGYMYKWVWDWLNKPR